MKKSNIREKKNNQTKSNQREKEIVQPLEQNNQLQEKSYTNKEYKDRLFKFIFKDKEKLLSLYNALNSSHYTNPDDIEITTLEDVIYCKMKDDISFIIDDRLSLFEHQSTYNPNMPLRGFLYFAKHFEKYIAKNEVDIYGSTLIELPTPKFVVFYNGTGMTEDRKILRLTDSFTTNKEKSCMELEAIVLNINYGKNKKLMESCRSLMEYSYFVQKVKDYSKKHERDIAIELAVDECIKENILKEILIKNRAEVVDMLLTEYDEEKRIRIMKKELEQERQRTEKARQELEESKQREEEARRREEKEKQEKEEYKKQLEEVKRQNKEILELLKEQKKM